VSKREKDIKLSGPDIAVITVILILLGLILQIWFGSGLDIPEGYKFPLTNFVLILILFYLYLKK
jgi:hypothetical protein